MSEHAGARGAAEAAAREINASVRGGGWVSVSDAAVLIQQAIDAETARLREAGGIRPEVMAFARLMEAKLRANDHKGGWRYDSPGELFDRLREEVDELQDVLIGQADPAVVGDEAADVANFALMLADVKGSLAAPGQGGDRG